MLTRARLEVEEPDAQLCVEQLGDLELTLMRQEACRYSMFVEGHTPQFHELAAELGRRLVEEVIEFDEGGPSYKARRVVHYDRIDGRMFGRTVELLSPTFAAGAGFDFRISPESTAGSAASARAVVS